MRITREIGIDMGHRVTNHGGKCRNLHGHRYRIEATVEAEDVVPSGEEEGMIMDFGFLKDIMMEKIDRPCDHGMCLWYRDPELLRALGPFQRSAVEQVESYGYYETDWVWGKLCILSKVPTAENLAMYWFDRMSAQVQAHLDRNKVPGRLYSVKVWETPNCSAIYKE